MLDSPVLARGLGALVVLYGGFAFRASVRPPAEVQQSIWRDARLAGLFGGAVGTTFGALSSLFFAMHFDAIGMPKEQFRATMSMAVVTICVVRSFGYAAIGGYTRDVLLILVITSPMALSGTISGSACKPH